MSEASILLTRSNASLYPFVICDFSFSDRNPFTEYIYPGPSYAYKQDTNQNFSGNAKKIHW